MSLSQHNNNLGVKLCSFKISLDYIRISPLKFTENNVKMEICSLYKTNYKLVSNFNYKRLHLIDVHIKFQIWQLKLSMLSLSDLFTYITHVTEWLTPTWHVITIWPIYLHNSCNRVTYPYMTCYHYLTYLLT